MDHELRRRRILAWLQIAGGVIVAGGGALVSFLTFRAVASTGGTYYVMRGAIIGGVLTVLIGIWKLMAAHDAPDSTPEERAKGGPDLPAASVASGFGYKSFVALRYLMDPRRRIAHWVQIVIGACIVLRLVAYFIWGDGLGEESIDTPWGIGQIVVWVVLVATLFVGVLRYSKPAMVLFTLGVVVGIGALVAVFVVKSRATGMFEKEDAEPLLQTLKIVALSAFGLAAVATFFGAVRAVFTFFTTVPIGGVWIGTAALVCVLSVMSGFETDLRDKILGSNAHLQIAKEEGDFTDWRAMKKKIDAIPGIVASTPFAMSEVVVAANNNGMNVIIKGIDPATVGLVTDLVDDIEAPCVTARCDEATTRAERERIMKKLAPLIDDRRDLTVPQNPMDVPTADPAPEGMPLGGPPIDFSTPDAGSGAGSGSGGGQGFAPDAGSEESGATDAGPVGSNARGSDGRGSGSDTTATDRRQPIDPATLDRPIGPFGGDANDLLGDLGGDAPIVDKRPDDFISADEGPADYSEPDMQYRVETLEGAIGVIEPWEGVAMSERTKSLPGILVGRELMKQTHLWPDQEVRVVSPLSDPANPDATGTPIPFNRDYRIAGSFYTGMYEYDLKYVYVTLDSLQQFLDRGDAVDGIEVRIGNPDDTDRFVKQIQQQLGPGYRVVDWKELNRSLFSALKLEKIAMFLVLGIVILVASFSIVGNLIMVVVEKQREIALLKTLGASDVGVMQLFAIQGFMIGIVGTLLGILTGLLGCWLGKRFGLPLNPNVYYIDRLPIHVEPSSVIAAALAGVLISIAATLYPAMLAARVRPAAGMRH